MIKHEDDKWVLYSKDGSKKLGEFDSKEAAMAREAEIERIKHAKESESWVIVDDLLQEREFSEEERKALAKKGHALPDGSFPISTIGDLKNAIQAFGRAGNKAAAKAHIKKRARALGATDLLPEDWMKEAMSMAGVKAMMKKDMSTDEMLKAMTDSGMSEEEARAMIAKARDMMKESEFADTFDTPIFEAVQGTEGREWDVTLILAGKSKNKRNYASNVLTEAVPLYEGVPAFADHDTDEEFRKRPERSVKDKVGIYRNVRLESVKVDGKPRDALRARFKVIAPWLRTNLLEAHNAGEMGFYGFSHNIYAQSKSETVEGETVEDVKKIIKVRSVDVVTDPSAGGRLDRLVASNRPQEGEIEVTPEEIQAMVEAALKAALPTALKEAAPPPVDLSEITRQLEAFKEQARVSEAVRKIEEALGAVTGLSEPGKELLRKRLKETAERRDIPEDELKAAVQESVDYEAAYAQKFANPTIGAIPRAVVGATEKDKMYKALQGLFENREIDGVPPFRSLKEGVCRWNGWDYWETTPQHYMRAFRGTYDSAVEGKQMKESLQVSDWASVFADVMYNRLLKAYNIDAFQVWRQFCSEIVPVNDFMSHNWTRVGGYADLSSVSEQATYPELTSPGDEATNFAVGKFGGIDNVTWESIVNDHIGAIRRLPVEMGKAAARTLCKDIMDLITTDNPTCDYDSTALWSHSNSGTSALTLSAVNSSIIAMRDVTRYGTSAEILGPLNYPAFVIVPNELEMRARRIFEPSPSYTAMILDSDAASADGGTGIDPASFAGKGTKVVVWDYLTAAATYYFVANPANVDTVIVGFLNGNEAPEMFVQDQPNVGSTFTADKVSYKVRAIWGSTLADHRGFYRQVG